MSTNHATKWLTATMKARKNKIMRLLDQKPERVDAVLDFLEKDIDMAPKKRPKETDVFSPTLMKLYELPKK